MLKCTLLLAASASLVLGQGIGAICCDSGFCDLTTPWKPRQGIGNNGCDSGFCDLTKWCTSPAPATPKRTCGNGRSWRITLTTDNYGYEQSWKLINQDTGATISSGPPLGFKYPDNTKLVGQMCLPYGAYTLEVKDTGEDGLCCKYGKDGLFGKIEASIDKVQHVLVQEGSWEFSRHDFDILPHPPQAYTVEEKAHSPGVLKKEVYYVEAGQGVTEYEDAGEIDILGGTDADYNLDNTKANEEREREKTLLLSGTGRRQAPFALAAASWAVGLALGGVDKRLGVALVVLAGATVANGAECGVCAARPPSTGNRCFKLEILTDGFGKDTTWEFRDTAKTWASNPSTDYGNSQKYTKEFCVPQGEGYTYELVMKDAIGGALCCKDGHGYYKLYVKKESGEWEKIIHSGNYGANNFAAKVIKHKIITTDPTLTQRDQDWLESHNTRRKKYHEKYAAFISKEDLSHNEVYQPLKYSKGLEASSLVWAKKLIPNCGKGMYHEIPLDWSENIAANTGGVHPVRGGGRLWTTDEVMYRFVEREETWTPKTEPHNNNHFTTALWRSSRYVGCAEVVVPFGKTEPKTLKCRIQVCRYATGKCGTSRYESSGGEYWMNTTMEAMSTCGPLCPPEGCH